MDGVVALGFHVVHPVRQSAGMDPPDFNHRYGHSLGTYGGLHVRTILGHGDLSRVETGIRRSMSVLKPGGSFIFYISPAETPHRRADETIFARQLA